MATYLKYIINLLMQILLNCVSLIILFQTEIEDDNWLSIFNLPVWVNNTHYYIHIDKYFLLDTNVSL